MEDVFNLDETQAGSFLTGQTREGDGLLRPKLEEGKDGKRELTIRLLPNMTREGKIGPTAIEKHIHYAKFPNNPEVQGYFDCLKDLGKECPLCTTFWALKNTKTAEGDNKAAMINRSTKYYSYVYVVEDSQVPDNQGKIFIFPFGYKIFQKIKAMAERSRKPIKVEDLIYGANLNLIIEEVGGFYNYDASSFESPSPIEIDGTEIKVNEDGSVSKETKSQIVDFLMSREHDLEDWISKEWTPEQYDKVDKITALLLGTSAGSTISRPENTEAPLTSANVFDEDEDEDDEDDTVEEVQAPKKRATKKTEAKTEDEDVSQSDVKAAKSKAAAFFDDDEE